MIVPAIDILPEVWDAFVLHHPSGWFWHTRGWLAYQLAYVPGSVDESFAVLDDDAKLIAVAPLLATPASGGASFTFGSRPTPTPIGDVAGVTAAWEEINARALRAVPSGVFEGLGEPCGVVRRIVDIRCGPRWSDVRKSYRSLIHGAERAYSILSYTAASVNADSLTRAFAQYQHLHREVYHDPRPAETYRLQAEWLRAGQAMVTLVEDIRTVWGAAYWFCWKGEAYYGSGVYVAHDIAHAVMWHSLRALSSLVGVHRAVLGYLGEAVTEKERSIEFFKTGFGGTDEPVLRRYLRARRDCLR